MNSSGFERQHGQRLMMAGQARCPPFTRHFL
jgi:hypothetical protein